MINKTFTLTRKDNKLKVIFDMDDVIADFMGYVLPLLNKIFNKDYVLNDIKDWDLNQYFKGDILEIFKQKGLFYNLEPKNDVLKEFPKIYNNPNFDVWIVTSCVSPECYLEKLQWMKKFFPDFPVSKIISCSEKDTIWADVIIDDGLHNLESFELIGEPVVYDMPHNRRDKNNNFLKYKRVFCMKEIRLYLQNKIKNTHLVNYPHLKVVGLYNT